MSIVIRKSEDRGHVDHGWLDTYHSFSFGGYHDSKFESFGKLIVVNEDRIAPSKGFKSHSHANNEIFSYVISGALRHEDSMGNSHVIKRGGIQFTSAGRGIHHSEFNASDEEEVHLLQIWVQPTANGLKPSYKTKHFPDDDKKGKLLKVMSPTGQSKTIKIHQDFSMYSSILVAGEQVAHSFTSGRKGYLHLVMNKTGASINIKGSKSGIESKLKEGDTAFITDEEGIEIQGLAGVAEFVLCDLV